ncbi:restriction endonuclease subunit S [Maribacter antarcticus]|uniref:restriction endonuclease subunit S n=1 Tax=Maribacter antarcticus TaxID=505250 RepID=UPI00146F9D9E|nr:restriction endonuclease subunit S [Maribacter antarcticus]
MLEIASKITDGTHDTPQKVTEGIPYLTAIHVKDGNIDFKNCYYLSQEDHDKIYKRCNPEFGDLLIVNIGAGTATCASVSVDYQFSLKNVALIKPNKKIVEPDYLTQLQRKKAKKLFHMLTSGGAQPFFSLKQIGKLKVEFPTLPEQQKIASFLTAVDTKIQQLTKKAALLAQYKKGVMQQLFSGALRFKPALSEVEGDEHGNAYPDWEEKCFGDLYSFHTTNSLSRDKLNYESGIVYNIHYGDIHTKFKTAFNLPEEYIPFVNDDIDLSKIKLDSYCVKGDLVMADASEDYADIGKTIELVDLKGEKVLAGLHTFLARPTTSKTAIGFFSYLLKSWSIRKQTMVIAQGSKVLSLSTGRVAKLKLKLPVIEEQQKIATYLSSIDTKIETINNQITQTQTFKKGLLQQMFV